MSGFSLARTAAVFIKELQQMLRDRPGSHQTDQRGAAQIRHGPQASRSSAA